MLDRRCDVLSTVWVSKCLLPPSPSNPNLGCPLTLVEKHFPKSKKSLAKIPALIHLRRLNQTLCFNFLISEIRELVHVTSSPKVLYLYDSNSKEKALSIPVGRQTY